MRLMSSVLEAQAPKDGRFSYKGTAQIAVKIQHKDPFLADQGAIRAVLAVENDVVPFDRLLTCCSSVWLTPS